MKKVIIAIIALLYLVSASGVVVDIHYCLDNDFGVAITIEKDKKGCCDTQTKWIKLQDAHQHVKLPKQVKNVAAEANIPRFAVANTWMAAGGPHTLHYNASPNQQVNAIYLRNCVLRI